MNAFRVYAFACCAVVICLFCTVLGAQEPASAEEGQFASAEGLVRDIYKSVSFTPDALPDWDKVRSMFIKQAVVVLRTSREETTVFSVDGFVDDFVKFLERPDVRQAGFTERVVRLKSTVYGDMAHVLVLYEASVTGSPRPPQQGVDSFQLIRKDGRWWIVSITNEIPTPKRPIPKELRD